MLALITGASSGLGADYARTHAAAGGDLILVARRGDRLQALADELTARHRIHAYVLTADLSQPHAAERLYRQVLDLGLLPDILINNAGLGGQGSFATRSLEDDRGLLSVNILALTELTKLFLPHFIERHSGYLLNVASIAALMPGPYQATYFASKAYVRSFTEALHEELRGTGVTATVVLPGGLATGFGAAAHTEGTLLDRLLTHSSAQVAECSYQAMLRGQRELRTGLSLYQRLLLRLVPFVPQGIVLRLASRVNR